MTTLIYEWGRNDDHPLQLLSPSTFAPPTPKLNDCIEAKTPSSSTTPSLVAPIATSHNAVNLDRFHLCPCCGLVPMFKSSTFDKDLQEEDDEEEETEDEKIEAPCVGIEERGPRQCFCELHDPVIDLSMFGISMNFGRLPAPYLDRFRHIALLGCPSFVTLDDLIGFLMPVWCDCDKCAIVLFSHATSSVSQYAILLRLREPSKYSQIHDMYTGQLFPSTEGDTCLCVPVDNVQYCELAASYATVGAENHTYHDVFASPSASSTSLRTDQYVENNSDMEGVNCVVTSLFPACYSCLCLLDEPLQGIISSKFRELRSLREGESILCNMLPKHKSERNSHCQTPMSMDGADDSTHSMHGVHMCMLCSVSSELRSCLVCGFIGCGRNRNGHSLAHFHCTNGTHQFAYEHDDDRIWDYVNDCYVHYLADTASVQKHCGVKKQRAALEEEAVSLLSVQVHSQRSFYMDKIARMEQTSASDFRNTQSDIFRLQSLVESLEENDSRMRQQVARAKEYNEKQSEAFSLAIRDLSMLKKERERLASWAAIEKEVIDRTHCAEQLSTAKLKEAIREMKEEIGDLITHLNQSQRMARLGVDGADTHMLLLEQESNRGKRGKK
eukprot:m.41118 g.41118  ORF g.41118 m.41118 type:complete len:611 (+) comp6980_c2_seq2:55-1887(+)